MSFAEELSPLKDTNNHGILSLPWMMPVTLAVILILVSFQYYLLFHVLAELFAIVIGVLLFVIAWQTYPFSRNNFLMFLACGYFWVGGLDMVHTITYPEMKIIPAGGQNTTSQLWIVTRYCEALILLIAPLYLVREVNRKITFFVFAGIAAALCGWVLTGMFPDTFIVGQGLTPFKIYSEYVIIALLAGALAHLVARRELLPIQVFKLLTLSIVLTMGAELAFTFYVTMFGLSNLTGHIFKLFSFWLIFMAIIRTTLSEPYLALQNDIKIRTKAEADLEKARHYLQSVINSMPSALIGVNLDGAVTHWNEVAEKVCGLLETQALDHPLKDALKFFPRHAAEIIDAVANQKHLELLSVPHVTQGHTRYTNIMVYPLAAATTEGAVIRIDDVTERVRMEAMMVQTEKMLSVGGLAAGMAHEINNPLSGVLQGMQNVRRRLTVDMPANLKAAQGLGIDFDKLQEYLKQRRILDFFDAISDSGQRASTIVANMLGFSRKAGEGMEAVNVPEMVDQVLKLAAMDYDLKKQYDFKNISMKREFASDLPTVPCVRSEIQQVLLNLFTNVAHAFQTEGAITDNPEITLRTSQEGDMALIEVADNGPGMSAAVRGRVFEPFFTTKPPGKGTGLGLSVAYYIVCDEHHGRMEVESSPGQGATFKIWLSLKQEQD